MQDSDKTQMQKGQRVGRVIFRAYVTTKEGRRIYPRRAKALRIVLG